MIKGLLMGLIVFIIVLVINMSKKKEWERRGNSVAVIKKVTYTQPIKVGLFSKPVYYNVDYDVDVEYEGHIEYGRMRLKGTEKGDIEKKVGKRINGYYVPGAGEFTYMGDYEEGEKTASQNVENTTPACRGTIYDVVMDDGSSSVMDEGELKEYAVRKKQQLDEDEKRRLVNWEQEIDNYESSEQVRFCRKCGRKLAAEAVFCPECGTKVIVLSTPKPEQIPEPVLFPKEKGTPVSALIKDSSPQLVLDYQNKGLSPVLRRAFILAEDGEWEKADSYFERVLDEEPENAYAYLGKLLVNKRVHAVVNLYGIAELANDKAYTRALQYADEELKKMLLSLLEKKP